MWVWLVLPPFFLLPGLLSTHSRITPPPPLFTQRTWPSFDTRFARSILPLMLQNIDDPRWLAKANKLATLFVDLWTRENSKGEISFASTYFSSLEVSSNPGERK